MKKEHREKTSLRTTQSIVNHETKFGKRKYENGMFRSKYESAFAAYLTELGIKWGFEKAGEEIVNITDTKLHYIPDFYLPEYRLYVEIANGMTKRLQQKMFLYNKRRGMKIELIVFDKEHLMDMFNSKFTIYDIIGYPKKKNRLSKQEESR